MRTVTVIKVIVSEKSQKPKPMTKSKVEYLQHSRKCPDPGKSI